MSIKIEKGISIFQGDGASIEGVFQFDKGTVKLNTNMKGRIFASRGTLIVGKMAIIEAEIQAGKVIVMGQVNGLIFAEDKIELYPPSRIFGYIQAPEILIAEGVRFHGKCHVSNQYIKEKQT